MLLKGGLTEPVTQTFSNGILYFSIYFWDDGLLLEEVYTV